MFTEEKTSRKANKVMPGYKKKSLYISNKMEPVQSLEAMADRIVADGNSWTDPDFKPVLSSLFDSNCELEEVTG